MPYVNFYGGAAPAPPSPPVPADTGVDFMDISPNDGGLGHIFVFRGVDAVTPLDVTPTTASPTGTQHLDPPAITPVTSGAAIVAFGVFGAVGLGISCSNMDGLLHQVFNGLSRSGEAGACYKLGWTSGAFDPAQFNSGGGSGADGTCSCTVALRPASGQTIQLVGSVMTEYPAGAASMTIPLNSGLSGGLADHVDVGDFILVGTSIVNVAGGDYNMIVDTAGYTEICDLFVNVSRASNLGVHYKFVTT